MGVKGASYTGDMAIDSIVFGSAAKPCIGDFNADKVVDAKDLLNLLGRFAAANSHKYTGTDAGKRIKHKKFSGKRTMCTGDLTGDSSLDVMDLLEILKLFGTTTPKNKSCGKC